MADRVRVNVALWDEVRAPRGVILPMLLDVRLRRYGMAIASSALALVLGLKLDAPVSCFCLAVIVSCLYGGLYPGLLAVLLSSLGFDYYSVPPLNTFDVEKLAQLRLAAFIGALLSIVWVVELKRRAEQSRRIALSESFDNITKVKDRLRLIIDTIPALAWGARPDGFVEFYNQRWLDYTGLQEKDVTGWAWGVAIHPDDAGVLFETWERIIATKEPGEAEGRMRRFDGEFRWFLFRAEPLRDADGKVVRWYGINTDIEDRKKLEETLRNSQSRLSRAAQIAAVGELAASIAHEVNQPLTAAVTNANACLQWLAAQPPRVDKARVAAERIVRDGTNAAEVVRRIRALFKRTAPERVPLKLNEVISEALGLIHAEVSRRSIIVQTDLQPDLPSISADSVQLQQVLHNLFMNGMEAMDNVPHPKTLVIRSRHNGSDAVQVEVKDHGTGIDDPEKIFDAFFTTKENGMGMGLSICRSIIESHDGRLWVESTPGEGSSFLFTLPLDAAPLHELREEGNENSPSS